MIARAAMAACILLGLMLTATARASVGIIPEGARLGDDAVAVFFANLNLRNVDIGGERRAEVGPVRSAEGIRISNGSEAINLIIFIGERSFQFALRNRDIVFPHNICELLWKDGHVLNVHGYSYLSQQFFCDWIWKYFYRCTTAKPKGRGEPSVYHPGANRKLLFWRNIIQPPTGGSLSNVSAQLPLLGILRNAQLTPKDKSGDSGENSSNTSADPGDHSPKAYIEGLWLLGILCLCAPICGIAAYCLDKRWPHTGWVPLVAFAIIAIIVAAQLGRLAKEIQGASILEVGSVVQELRFRGGSGTVNPNTTVGESRRLAFRSSGMHFMSLKLQFFARSRSSGDGPTDIVTRF